MAKWTINEGGKAANRYFATKRREAVLDLQLVWKRAAGPTDDLGKYRLPLALLAGKGLVRKRDDGQGYDIQIRVKGGVPFFSLNKRSEAPMAPYRAH